MNIIVEAVKKVFTYIIKEISKYLIYKKIGRQEVENEFRKKELENAEKEIKLREEYEKIDANNSSNDRNDILNRVRNERQSNSTDASSRVSKDS